MSQRDRMRAYVLAQYGVETEYPWEDDPSGVLRRQDSKKWFGVLMCVPGTKVGLNDSAPVDIMNVKLDPILVGSLRGLPGYAPAWHMNKTYWLTVLLNDTVDDGSVCAWIDQSYALAGKKRKRREIRGDDV